MLLQAGKNILQGLVNGITNMIGTVKSKLTSLTSMIPSWKGPAKRDRKLLYNAGELIMSGLIKGIDDQKRNLKRELQSVTKVIEGTDVGSIKGGTLVTDFKPTGLSVAELAGGRVGNNNTYNITVEAPVGSSPEEIGRTLIEKISAYETVGGTRWRTA
jgi:phage-related protein